MSTVFTASIGILVPFAIFAVLFFFYLHSLWLENAAGSESTKSEQDGFELREGGGAVFLSVGGGRGGMTSSFIDTLPKKKFFSSELRPGTTVRLPSSATVFN